MLDIHLDVVGFYDAAGGASGAEICGRDECAQDEGDCGEEAKDILQSSEGAVHVGQLLLAPAELNNGMDFVVNQCESSAVERSEAAACTGMRWYYTTKLVVSIAALGLIGHVAGGPQIVSLADGVLLFIGRSEEGCSYN